MAQALLEYADWLDERGLLWPTPPVPAPARATPYLEALPDVQAVTWGAYGTLLLVSDGRLRPVVSSRLRMEVAIEKTIEEFNMWHSMSRKPGAPWEYMLHQLQNLVDHRAMSGTGHLGEAPEVNLAKVWSRLIDRLRKKDYTWDQKKYGDLPEFSAKVAFFFQSCLQGVRAAPHALEALRHVRAVGCRQGIIADGQVFTLVQLLRGLRGAAPVPPLTKLLSSGCVSLSYQFGVRQPAETLFRACLANLARHKIAPRDVLHVASRLKEELGPAKRLGMKTALYAGDQHSLEATAAEINDPHLRPDRILTDLKQIRQIVREE
jgi:FMN phosphatase YigB (HAD superfamily)